MTSSSRASLAGDGSSRKIDQSYWRRDETVPLVDHTVGSLLAERASSQPHQLALVGNSHGAGSQRRLSYGDLYGEAGRAARALLKMANPGEYVAIWAPNVVEWPIVQYGAALAGVTLVALNPSLRTRDLVYALNHSRAVALIHADRNRDDDLAAIAQSVRGQCPHVRHVVSLSSWPDWLATGSGSDSLPPTAPDMPAMLQYTSGTTGTPKGVLLRHGSLVNVAKLTVETAAADVGAVSVNPLPMFHTASCVIGTLGPLWLGGCVVLIEQFSPGAVLSAMRDEGASILFGVPTVLGALVEAARTAEVPPPALRTVMIGAANLPHTVIEAAETLFGARVHNLFGQTELAPVLSMTRRDDSHDDLVRTVGRPLPQVDAKIADQVTGEPLPLGQVGEICARGYQQLIEYLHDPESTARTVDAEGWVHTGDLGKMDERGMLTVTGRLKDLIIRGGENIAPAEIESCLVEHEAVLDAAVVGVPDDKWGEVVAAVIRLRREWAPGLRDRLESHCRERLARYKVPQYWLVVDELPLTPTGKVQKFRLVDMVVGGGLDALL
ncbi:class I adenylate-forming enzyme family protein [Nocardia neocaledoniensis]|uniref:class I adenylate-forming enzyme family protein n=1 Tax=Nocardia neocaledoniensis TaxID=236511 RepID=UPI0024575CEA|nr:AMP-binding protein [Nocardia neocaledoniensis]